MVPSGQREVKSPAPDKRFPVRTSHQHFQMPTKASSHRAAQAIPGAIPVQATHTTIKSKVPKSRKSLPCLKSDTQDGDRYKRCDNNRIVYPKESYPTSLTEQAKLDRVSEKLFEFQRQLEASFRKLEKAVSPDSQSYENDSLDREPVSTEYAKLFPGHKNASETYEGVEYRDVIQDAGSESLLPFQGLEEDFVNYPNNWQVPDSYEATHSNGNPMLLQMLFLRDENTRKSELIEMQKVEIAELQYQVDILQDRANDGAFVADNSMKKRKGKKASKAKAMEATLLPKEHFSLLGFDEDD